MDRIRDGRRHHLGAAARSPLAWHIASLLVGGALILWLQTSQWFFFDEWAFLMPYGPGLFEPHVGHWSTSPMLIYRGLRDSVGLGSYLPFAIPVTLIHLLIAHLVWRLCLRARVAAPLATAGVAVLVVLGSGAENILWAFQIGFLGALALGLAAFLLVTVPVPSAGRTATALALSLWSLTWSGTAIPMVVATVAMLWHRGRRWWAAGYAAICGGTWLTWFALAAAHSPHNPDTGGLSLEKVFVAIPQFLGVMLLLGWQQVFGVPGVGFAIVIAVGVWLVRLARSRRRVAGLSVALILGSTAVLFALMTAYSRAEWSVGSGRASRYIYVLVVLLLPLCLAALTRVWHARPGWRLSAVGAVGALAAYQAFVLVEAAADEADREDGSHRAISAAIALARAEPQAVDLRAQPDPVWAPDIELGGALALHERWGLAVVEFTDDDADAARETVGLGE